MKHIGIFTTIALIGCSAPPDMTEYHEYKNKQKDAGPEFDINDPDSQNKVVNESLQHWDNAVGYRNRDINIRLTEAEFDFPGTCIRRHGKTTIDIYLNLVDNDYNSLRAIFLHELAHAHLNCNEEDHVTRPESILSTKLEAIEVDIITLELLDRKYSSE